ncbi:hypothetical protein CLOHIR_01053 [Peptacetobacter hiranonis DSM 13275]|uniref:Uncharacterized protein n=1 Tax=Peptacetobacter hiranonis (strain DSM 13275 / JCM 10541 / KCTC 15199 / TO-931) TaxID=500633 RepID=B6FYU9_PEPHT|nr:hypothetical protein CLOHIR_01053 [Peptacetobacter hiranonis DSM 13275]
MVASATKEKEKNGLLLEFEKVLESSKKQIISDNLQAFHNF